MHDLLDGTKQALHLIFSLDRQVLEIALLSVAVSGSAALVGTLIGVPLGTALGMVRFRGKSLVMNVVYTLMGLPSVVVGLLIYLLLSRSGPLGELGWLFTPKAIVIAQVVLATPIILGLSAAAVEGVSYEKELMALSLGANRRQLAWVMMQEARYGLLAAVITGFSQILAEVGAVLMVGGNIKGFTRVMTTAIVLETNKGDFALAMALGIILLLMSFTMTSAIRLLQGQGARP
jgi:tungstate transport system permease protein